MAEYRCTPAFGWGVVGPAQAGIRREAARLGLKIEPFPFRKLHELIAPCPVIVEGDEDAVKQFEAFMRRRGYDDRKE